MRVALVGKGGSGKSALAGVLARVLARQGEPVLAVDSDPMPGLSLSLGMGVLEAPIPDDAVEEKEQGQPGPRFGLRPNLSAAEAIERYATVGPDGVRFLQFGKLRGHVSPFVRSQFAFRGILDQLPVLGWTVVGDLPGGTRQPFAGWAGYASQLLVVVEPTAKGMLSARRLARLAQRGTPPLRVAAVANKVREPGDIELVRARTGLDVLAGVPEDPAVGTAERLGVSVLDHEPGSPAVTVIASLAQALVVEHQSSTAPGRAREGARPGE